VFGSNSTYTIKSTYSGTTATEQETGSYSYDSTRKRVYFKVEKSSGQTAAEYYDTVYTSTDASRFIDNDAYKAAQTNRRFSSSDSRYDPTAKTISD